MVVYIIDTSAWISLSEKYPLDKNASLWKKLEGLINDGKIVCPTAVRKEIKKEFNPKLHHWCRRNKTKLFVHNSELIAQVEKVLEKNDSWKNNKKQSSMADPHVVGLAVIYSKKIPSTIIVTQESKNINKNIPKTAEKFRVACIDMDGLIKREALMS